MSMKGTIEKAVAANIRCHRERHGWTQKDLAEKIGYTPSAVNHWELAKGTPQLVTLYRLAEAMGVEIEDLLPTRGAVIRSAA